MKEYNVKYNRGDLVYILLSKSIFKSEIESIRITENKDYIKIIKDNLVKQSGIKIEYLVIVKEEKFNSGGTSTSYDWYNQDDVFLDKESLIRQIIY